jgi:transcriptional regulator with XRE-family HTH domain
MLVRDIPQGASGSNTPLDDAEPDAIVARRVRQLREQTGLTQRQVADLMTAAGHRMHQTTVAKIEAGDRPVSVGEAVRLAGVFGVAMDALLTEPAVDDERQRAIAELVDAQVAIRSLEHEVAERQKALDRAQILRDDAFGRLTNAQFRINDALHELDKLTPRNGV